MIEEIKNISLLKDLFNEYKDNYNPIINDYTRVYAYKTDNKYVSFIVAQILYENAEIIEDIAAFRKTIVDESKLIEIDPQTLLAPLQQFEEYSDLLTYLQTRYWKK